MPATIPILYRFNRPSGSSFMSTTSLLDAPVEYVSRSSERSTGTPIASTRNTSKSSNLVSNSAWPRFSALRLKKKS